MSPRHFGITAMIIALLGGAALGSVMKMTVARFPLPADDEPRALPELFYGLQTPITVHQVSLERKEASRERTELTWTFLGSNPNARIQRINLAIELLDAEGHRLHLERSIFILLAVSVDQAFELEYKVKSDVLDRTEEVKIQADFATL